MLWLRLQWLTSRIRLTSQLVKFTHRFQRRKTAIDGLAEIGC